jgi:hypothetical protein
MGIRTPDLLHAMEARYQLRHSPLRSMSLAASGRCPVPLFEDRLPGGSLRVSCGWVPGRMTLVTPCVSWANCGSLACMAMHALYQPG